MPSATYKFSGDDSPVRFLSKNRPSTDALNVLHQWLTLYPGRAFDVIEDADDHLVVKLTVANDDEDAGPQLQSLGHREGVRHEFMSGN